jgi:hypothetical protein
MSNSDRDSIPAVPTPEPMCDHICIRDAGHVERGEPHFYGYELPSPRDAVRKLEACGRGWRKDRAAIHEQVAAALRYVEAGDGHGVIVLRDLLAWLEQGAGKKGSST